jgi:hypothetical protein
MPFSSPRQRAGSTGWCVPANAIVLTLLPVMFAPMLVASLAEVYGQHSGGALLVAFARGVLIRVPTAEGWAVLLAALALLNWVRCRGPVPSSNTDEAWELFYRATALEAADHIEAALISYENVARKFPDHPAAEAARLSWDALQMAGRGTQAPRSEAGGSEATTLHARLMRLRPLVHP